MVAPKYGPTLPVPQSDAEIGEEVNSGFMSSSRPDSTNGGGECSSSSNISGRGGKDDLKRRASREAIMSGLVSKAGEHRLEGNRLFKFQDYERAAKRYCDAIFMLQKVPTVLALADMVKVFNNRSKCYVKLGRWRAAEDDTNKVLGIDIIDDVTRAALLLTRYHARSALGSVNEAFQDLKESADLGNKAAIKELFAVGASTPADATVPGTQSGDGGGGSSSDDRSPPGIHISQGLEPASGTPAGAGGLPKTDQSSQGKTVGGDNGVAGAAGEAGRRARSITTAGAAHLGERDGKTKDGRQLEARLGAGAGEELVFGGPVAMVPGDLLSSVAKRWVPEDDGDHDAEDNAACAKFWKYSSGSRAAAESSRVGVEGQNEEIVVPGSGGGGRSSRLADVLSVPRKRRTRPRSSCSQQQQQQQPQKHGSTTIIVTATFTPTTPSSTSAASEASGNAATEENADDTIFPPPHPLFLHPLVRKCLAWEEVGSAGGSGICDHHNIATVANAAAVIADDSGAEVDGPDECVRPAGDGHTGRRGTRMGSVVSDNDGGGDGENDGGLDCAAQVKYKDRGNEDRERAGEGARESSGFAAARGAVGGRADHVCGGQHRGPPPARQAQDIRLLVAQATAKPDKGDIWAVLDSKWWLRWQRYTGCDKDAVASAASVSAAAASADGGVAVRSNNYSDCDSGDDGEHSGANAAKEGEGEVTASHGERYNRDDRSGGGNRGVDGGGGEGDIKPGASADASGDRVFVEVDEEVAPRFAVAPEAMAREHAETVGAAEAAMTAAVGDDDDAAPPPAGGGDASSPPSASADGNPTMVPADKEGVSSPVVTVPEDSSGKGGGHDGNGDDGNGNHAARTEVSRVGADDGVNVREAAEVEQDESGKSKLGTISHTESNSSSRTTTNDNCDEPAVVATVGASKKQKQEQRQSRKAEEDTRQEKKEEEEDNEEIKGETEEAPVIPDATAALPITDRYPHPGPIDNSALVLEAGAPGTILGVGRRLRMRLVRGYHFVLVPQEAWSALHAWYGGGPVLPRQLVPVKDSTSGHVVYEPQLYPEFSLLDPVLRANSMPLPAASSASSCSTRQNQNRNHPASSSRPDFKDSSCDAATMADGGDDEMPVVGPPPPPPPAPLVSSSSSSLPNGYHPGTNGHNDGGATAAAPKDDGDGGHAAVGHDPVSAGGGGRGERKEHVVVLRREGERRAASGGLCAACGRHAKEKCARCHKNSHRVFYCSQSCQEAHWRYHKKLCGGRDPQAALAMAKRGKAGLINLGNTCFLNSAVQCLSHVQPLTQHILTNAFRGDINDSNPLGTGGCLVREYEGVLKDLWFGSGSAVSPNGLKTAIAKFAPQFNGYAQQDSQEVLSFLLDGLHEDLNRVLKKPYTQLPDGECGRSDAVIAAECWDMFSKRDRSVLVESLYGQFKSTLECPQCWKLSRKFDEFNVMPVELLAGQRYAVQIDLAPLLAPARAAPIPIGDDDQDDETPLRAGGRGVRSEGETVSDRAARLLGGEGKEGRKARRVGVVVPRDGTIGDVKDELAFMFGLVPEELLVVALPTVGPPLYRILHDSDQAWKYAQEGFDLTAHMCIPGMRYGLVVNVHYEGGRHMVSNIDSGGQGQQRQEEGVLQRWEQEVCWLRNLRSLEREAPFLVSYPHDASCLELMEIVWEHMRDFLHLTAEEYEALYMGQHLARTGQIKLCEASSMFTSRYQHEDEVEVRMRERFDERNRVVVVGDLRYLPPLDWVSAAAVSDAAGTRRRRGLDVFRLSWVGPLLEKLDAHRLITSYGTTNHPSSLEAEQRVKRVCLTDCLEKFSVPETLCEDNSWYCGNCKELRQAVKTIQVWSLPKVLILHFKRFAHAGPTRGKVEVFVDFPINGLDMSPYCRGETLEGGRAMPALYDLFAVSNHMGGMGHGHYTAFVRDWDDSGMSRQWFVCDDQDCRPVDEANVRTAAAYVLFYRRRPLVGVIEGEGERGGGID